MAKETRKAQPMWKKPVNADAAPAIAGWTMLNACAQQLAKANPVPKLEIITLIRILIGVLFPVTENPN